MAFAPLRSLPKGVLGILYEVSRHLLRRPVVGICAAARVPDGRWVMIRRADTGTWAMPGGTLEWGEMLRPALARELEEEAGIVNPTMGEVIGVYSRPDRDVRFHAVTILVACKVEIPLLSPKNPLEIREVGLFETKDVPRPLAMGMDDMFNDACSGKLGLVE